MLECNVCRLAFGLRTVVPHWNVESSTWLPLHSDDVLILIMTYVCSCLYICLFCILYYSVRCIIIWKFKKNYSPHVFTICKVLRLCVFDRILQRGATWPQLIQKLVTSK